MKQAPDLPEPLRETLEMVADLTAGALDPWWIISSAAVALHGAAAGEIRDVDLLMSSGDAARMLETAGVASRAGQATDLFRSAIFGTWSFPPLDVEIFGDFEVAGANGWTRVEPVSREAIAVRDRTLFIPSAAELKAMLIEFGRPKDLARARLLD